MIPQKPASAYETCYHAGRYVPWESAVLHTGSIALRYAISVFEGVRIYRHGASDAVSCFELDAHVSRLKQSLQLMGLPDPGVSELPSIIDALIAKNHVTEDAYVRPSISACNPGELSAAAESCMTVTVSKMGRKKWLAEGKRMNLAISAWQRSPDLAFPAAAKNISNYAGGRLAAMQAKAEGYDGVVLTNAAGYLSEAPTAALFLVRDGAVYTPPLSEQVLPSITRRVVMEICARLAIPHFERRLSRTDAYLSDEAFLCGTGIEFAQVASFDRHELRSFATSPLSNRIISAFFELARTSKEQRS